MGNRFIRVSFNKDASPAAPDPRDKLFTYIDATGDLKPGELAEVKDHRTGKPKRVMVMELGVPAPSFECKPATRRVPPAEDELAAFDAGAMTVAEGHAPAARTSAALDDDIDFGDA